MRYRYKALLLAAAAFAVPAYAQDQGNDAGVDNQALGDIVVTAQRRAQSLQDVPVAITAITADALENSGVDDTVKLVQLTPGLTMTQQNTSVLPYLRGVGAASNAAGVESPVAFYVDGVYISTPYSALMGLNNIERIEVLRGPQGVAFGRNATGGAIRVITKDPEQDPQLDVGFTYESYETVSAKAYATGGITEGVAASLAVLTSHQGKGWATHALLDTDIDKLTERSVRGEIKIDPTSRFSVNLNADYSYRDTDIGLNRMAAPGTFGLDGVVGDPRSRVYRGEVKTSGRMEQYGAAIEATYDLGGAQLSSTTAWRQSKLNVFYEQEGTPLPFVVIPLHQKDRSFQQELILTTNIDRADVLIGAIYYEDRSRYLPLENRSGIAPSFNILRFADLGTKSYAGFAQVTVPLTSSTNITGGVRYTDEKKTGFGFHLATPGNTVPTGQTVPGTATPGERVLKYSELTFRFALDQKLGQNVMAYASFNRGFKSGGFNSALVTAPPVLPENLDAYEAGVKTEWFDGQLRFNVAGYYYDYSNIQLTTLALGGFNVLNAAKAKAKGVEIEALFKPRMDFGDLTLRASAAFADAEYTRYPNAAVFLPNPVTSVPAGVVCPATRPATVGGNLACVGDNSGNDLVRNPEFTLTGGVEYGIPVGKDVVTLNADVYHSSSFFFDAANRFENPAYTIVNAQVAYGFDNNRSRLRVFTRNLTNARYYAFGAEGGVGDAVTRGAPRTFGIGLDARF